MHPALYDKPALSPHEFAHLLFIKSLGNMEMFSARFIKHRFAPHAHSTWSIGVVIDGVKDNRTTPKRNDVFTSGEMILVRPGEIHGGSVLSENGCWYAMLYPSEQEIEHACREVGIAPDSIVRRPQPNATLARSLVQCIETLSSAYATEREKQWLWTEFIGEFLLQNSTSDSVYSTDTIAPQAINRAKDFLHEHCFDEVSLDRLAEEVGLTRFYLCRRFADAVGVSPHAYQLQLRIDKAKLFLRDGLALAEVAMRTGFADQSHFSRTFKACTGVSPGIYARAAC